MDSKHLNGYLAEQRLAIYYSKLGYIIYWPNHSQGSCDFIAGKDNDLIRVQCKGAYWMKRSTGKEYLQCTIRKGAGKNENYKPYTDKECDIIGISSDERLWIIPVSEIKDVQTVVLDKKEKIRESSAFDWSIYEVK